MNNTIIKNIAEIEHQPYELIRKGIETGSIAIMYRGNMGIAIGTGLRTKINVNLGTSSGHCVSEEEIQKANIAELYSAETITGLSTLTTKQMSRESIRVLIIPIATPSPV